MRDNAHVTAAELASMLGISERGVYKNIAKLREAGIIRRNGSDIAGDCSYAQTQPLQSHHAERPGRQQVAQLRDEGKSMRAIAAELGLSKSTVGRLLKET